MEYEVKLGIARLGKASVEVKAVEAVRTRPAWKAELRIDGKIPWVYSLVATHTTWFDTASLYSLRYHRDQVERGRERDTYYEIFPERSTYRTKVVPDTMKEVSSVADPLDEASFLYFIRTTPLEVGQTYTYQRYFRLDRNPVIIRVLERDTISVPAGMDFPAIVIQPSIKTRGLFEEGGKAKIWLSDDQARIILKIQSEVAGGAAALHLNLTAYRPPKVAGR